jgi:shikimate kinase
MSSPPTETPAKPGERIDDIVLIGPVSVGKTTVGRCLAERLRVPLVSMDDLRESYYREIGYDEALVKRLFETEGAAGVWCYWKVFDPHSVERLLAEHRHCVIDMGGGTSVHEHDDMLKRVARALAPYPNVVLLLPAADRDESLRFLDARTGWGGKERNVNRILLEHRSNYELAKLTVYTAHRTTEDIAEEILRRVVR